uniref:BAG domain-containing protein n=1 Tax=Mucochytrium quahogii TaxID=96639 RepID=A0A7S2SNG4_9STRA|mmetsp:Transcript_535/g.687  ORF Transcript_535/g.687 Transcript_535/m.687 type:complete len:412 (-) Transcript_535:38-1273(-)
MTSAEARRRRRRNRKNKLSENNEKPANKQAQNSEEQVPEEETTHEMDSSKGITEDTVDENSPEYALMKESQVMLEGIEKQVARLVLRLNSAEQAWSSECVKVAVYKWFWLATHRVPKYYDKLDATKLRTRCGAIDEELMKVLLSLDAVLSYGSQELRARRKAIVTQVNGDLLPKADNLFRRASKLARFDVAIRSDVEHHMEELQIAKDSRAKSAEKPEETAEMESDSDSGSEMSTDESEPEASPSNSREKPTSETSTTNSNENASVEQPPVTKGKRCAPQYEIEDLSGGVEINIVVPTKLQSAQDAQVTVDRGSGELKVSINGYEPLQFDVSSKLLLPLETTYKLIGPHQIQITIPKAVRRVYQQPRRAAPQRLDNPFLAQAQRNPFMYQRDPYAQRRNMYQQQRRPVGFW